MPVFCHLCDESWQIYLAADSYTVDGAPHRCRAVFSLTHTPMPPAQNPAAVSPASDSSTAFKVLGAISVAHLMNDMIQSILLAIYPMLKESFSLSFAQIGLIT